MSRFPRSASGESADKHYAEKVTDNAPNVKLDGICSHIVTETVILGSNVTGHK